MPRFWINDIALTERLDSTDLHNVSRGHYGISKSADFSVLSGILPVHFHNIRRIVCGE